MIPLFIMLAGCGPKQTNPMPQSMSLSPSANVHLRNSFDTDPSAYLGRFVRDGVTGAYDESSTMSLACSEHVTHRRIDGGGVKYNELLEISSAASARLSVPLLADASGSSSANKIVRVSYELTGKMIGEIKDPAAFAACCKDSPDQCTRQYIGEFIEGRGAIYHQASNSVQAQAQAQGALPANGANGSVDLSHGKAWERGVEFPNPVFFAFKISETPYTQQTAAACVNFMTTLPPGDDDGVYLLGSNTSPAKNEATARRRALRDATMSAYNAFGIIPHFESPVVMEVQAREWCVESNDDRFSAKVLAYAKRPENPPRAASPIPVSTPTSAVAPAAPTVPVPAPTGASTSNRAPIQAAALSQLQASISAASFSEDKLAVVRIMATSNAFTVAQVASLMGAFSFNDDKVEAVTILRGSITDPQNGALLANSFTFSSDKQKVLSLFQ